jgi:16S rRNA processing protein RimM
MTDKICVGAIQGAFGVHGDVRIKSFCSVPDAIADYAPLTSEDGAQTFNIRLDRAIKNGFSARIDGVITKEQADTLRGTRLFALRDQLASLPDDEFYHTDLIGLTVLDTGGTRLGRVTTVQNHGAGDLLEIAPNSGDSIFLPFTRENVPTVDLASKRIIIDPPAGVFEG